MFTINQSKCEKDNAFYQIIVILEGIVQGGDPLAVSVYQHIPLLPETRRLKEDLEKITLGKRIARHIHWHHERKAVKTSFVGVRIKCKYQISIFINHVIPLTFNFCQRLFLMF